MQTMASDLSLATIGAQYVAGLDPLRRSDRSGGHDRTKPAASLLPNGPERPIRVGPEGDSARPHALHALMTRQSAAAWGS